MSGVRGPVVPVGVVAVLVGCLLLAGCTGGSSTPVSATTSTPSVATSSPTKSATAVETPSLPAAAQAGTRAGAKVFFDYFWGAYNYAFASLDAAPLRAASGAECQFCTRTVKTVGAAADAGQRFSGGLITTDVRVVAPLDAETATVVNAVMTQAEGRLVSGDGSTVRTFPARAGVRVDVGLRWENGRWKVVGVVLGPGSTAGP